MRSSIRARVLEPLSHRTTAAAEEDIPAVVAEATLEVAVAMVATLAKVEAHNTKGIRAEVQAATEATNLKMNLLETWEILLRMYMKLLQM